ncbi:MAG: histidine triad nucleotide-binding protein [Ornithinimicrobium sp.]|jgi:histidine triad (HIT) family protein|uniref:histidine triad nucleotide-binding protein n=1 Tax=Ornithinimicrobium sp. TaxID=1977084 RepID=UPI003D9AD8FD
MSDCLFCRIGAGEIPAEVVLETETTLAFRDITPHARVHVLVIPREHHDSLAGLAEVDAQGAADLAVVAGQVAQQEGIAESGYRVISNVGPDSGQEVPHVHLHVLGGERLGPLVQPAQR